ncbi:MAG: nodulation protein NfeD [Gammaproteobacteria bacterium]|nr:nodulation protein NfeD [Gammaproteobacteria bacterium]
MKTLHFSSYCGCRQLVFLLLLLLILPAEQSRASEKIYVLDIKGAIGPATADYLKRGLETARDAGSPLAILRIDTPGGLDTAMREIVQAIIASPVPVVSYVAPSGARAASAGTYILYASHVAAMAPGTNLGAATPVQIGGMPGLDPSDDKKNFGDDAEGDDAEKKSLERGESAAEGKSEKGKKSGDTMTHKIVNDAEAYLRSLAQMHGRNVEWAMKAVRESASLAAEDALKKNVIDLMAPNLTELLKRLHGREVKVQGQTRRLSTEGLETEIVLPDWRNRLLSAITDPNVAYILMLLGIYGLFFELSNPGSILPGVIGGICLLLALFAFQVLPVNYAGLALILLGIAFMVGEAFLPSFGALGIGGVISFIIGSIILLDAGVPGYEISRSVIGAVALISALFIVWLVRAAVELRKRPSACGSEGMLGLEAECVSCDGGKLRVFVQGETWNAHAQTAIESGQIVRITGVNGLMLAVEAVNEM